MIMTITASNVSEAVCTEAHNTKSERHQKRHDFFHKIPPFFYILRESDPRFL
jgi:hypothetical protein